MSCNEHEQTKQANKHLIMFTQRIGNCLTDNKKPSVSARITATEKRQSRKSS